MYMIGSEYTLIIYGPWYNITCHLIIYLPLSSRLSLFSSDSILIIISLISHQPPNLQSIPDLPVGRAYLLWSVVHLSPVVPRLAACYVRFTLVYSIDIKMPRRGPAGGGGRCQPVTLNNTAVINVITDYSNILSGFHHIVP